MLNLVEKTSWFLWLAVIPLRKAWDMSVLRPGHLDAGLFVVANGGRRLCVPATVQWLARTSSCSAVAGLDTSSQKGQHETSLSPLQCFCQFQMMVARSFGDTAAGDRDRKSVV